MEPAYEPECTPVVAGETCVCRLCEKVYEYSRDKRDAKETCRTCLINRHRFKLKAWMVAYKGGCCQLCGYHECLRSLDFHHIDPAEKEFGFGSKHNLGWDRLTAELDKCVCVCRNCHGEVEHAVELLKWDRRLPILDRLDAIHAAWERPVDFPTFHRPGWEHFHPAYGAPALADKSEPLTIILLQEWDSP